MSTTSPRAAPGTAPSARPVRAPRHVLVVLLLLALVAVLALRGSGQGGLLLHPDRWGQPQQVAGVTVPWPRHGQAALQVDGGPVVVHGDTGAAPIASVAKVMTAYLVLSHHPLARGGGAPGDGYVLTISSADVADTDRRRAGGESVVAVAAGERLTERQALEAVLLPSANNISTVLAVAEAGSVARFVTAMNDRATALGMVDTRYSDPSGYEVATTSTAADQVRLLSAAMRLPDFAALVAQAQANIPVAGEIASTDVLLGREGFLGGKTGSTRAAGGCFAFQSVARVDGRRVLVTGAVLGQPGPDLVTAGQEAAGRLLDAFGTPAPGGP